MQNKLGKWQNVINDYNYNQDVADAPLFVAPNELTNVEIPDVQTEDQQAIAAQESLAPKYPTNKMAEQEALDVSNQPPMDDAAVDTNTPPTPPTEYEKLQSQLKELRDLEQGQQETANKYNFGAKAAAIIGDTLARYNTGGIQKNAKANIQYTGPKLKEMMDIIGEAKAPGTGSQREELLNQYKQLQMNQLARDKMTAQSAEGKLNRDSRLDAARIGASARAGNRGPDGLSPAERAREERISEQNVNKDVQKLQNSINNSQEVVSAFNKIEDRLGFKLDDVKLDEKNRKILRDGKEVDLPGVSVPGYGRSTFYNGNAREIENAMTTVFNTVLQDRSGKAVTSNELERLRDEFSKGKYNTEYEMIQAMKDFKKYTKIALENKEAGFSKKAVEEYKDRGGYTSHDLGNTGNLESKDETRIPPPNGKEFEERNGKSYRWNFSTGTYQLN